MRLNSAIGMKRNLSRKYFYYINNAKWCGSTAAKKNSRNGNISCCRAALVVPLCKSIDLFLFKLKAKKKTRKKTLAPTVQMKFLLLRSRNITAILIHWRPKEANTLINICY